jgi:hypothetical protein
MKTASTNTSNTLHLFYLGDPDSVSAASTGQGPVYWVCDRHPSRMLGDLLEDPTSFQGVWLENFRILVSVGGRTRVFEIPDAEPVSRLVLAERALRRVLRGESPAKIQEALDSVPAGGINH